MAADHCQQCGAVCESNSSLCARCQTQQTLDTSRSRGEYRDDPTIASSAGGLSSDGQASPDGTEQLPGPHQAGDYLLLEQIARGGMGVVFRARHRKLNRSAAVKMILGGRFSAPEDIRRFYVEAEAAAKLDHPGIVPIFDIGEHQGQPYYAMKLIEGGSLADHHQRISADTTTTVRLMAKVARAVHHAHVRGILHRDLKPANILLDEDDNPLLTDLGLAKSTAENSQLTETGALLGTPSYMSPEQAEGGNTLTIATDIYALGAVLYELLVGQPPHRGKSAIDTVMQVLNQPIRPPRQLQPSIDRDLEAICMHCLEREPSQRYESAADLAQDLENWLEGEPILVRPPGFLEQVSHWMKRNQGIAYAMFALLCGSVLSAPLILSVLGTLNDPAHLYAGTKEDPTPFLYNLTTFPAWVSQLSGFVMLAVWMLLGLLVAKITKPNSTRKALFNGAIVGAASGLLFLLLLGWIMVLAAVNMLQTQSTELLAQRAWPAHAASLADVDAQLNQLLPGLSETADEDKPTFVAERQFADGLAQGSVIWLLSFVAAAVLALPIVIGAVLGFWLLDRGNHWLIMLPRYCIAWCACTLCMFVLLTVFGAGQINGKGFWELGWLAQVLLVVPAPTIAFLTLRRWKKPSLPLEAE